MKWDNFQRTVTLSTPEYIKQALHKFQHTLPTITSYAPHSHVVPTYGRQVQYEEPVETSNFLPPTETNLVTKGCCNISILWTRHGQHNFSFIEGYLIRTVVCNQKYFEKVVNYLIIWPKIQMRQSIIMPVA